MPKWFPYFDLACVAFAAGLWLFRPSLGFIPLIVGLIPWGLRWIRIGRPSFGTSFDLPLIVFLITALVSVWAAYDTEAAWVKFWLLIGASLLFFAFANWALASNKNDALIQAWALSLLGIATALYFILTHDWDSYSTKVAVLVRIGHALQSPLPRFPAELIHPNVVGGILAMLAPFAGAATLISWNEKRYWLVSFGLLGFVIILLGLLLTIARSAWLALGIACGLVVWWLIVRRFPIMEPERKRYLLFAVPSFLLLIVISSFLLLPGVRESVLDALPASESGLGRAQLYTNSLTLAADYPLIGAGLDGYMMLYSTYSLMTHVGFSTHSHSLYLDIVIEQGVIALVALLWMWLLMGEAVWITAKVNSSRSRLENSGVLDEGLENDFRYNRVSWHRMRFSSNYLIFGAATMSLIVLLVHGLLDDSIYNSRAVLLFFVPLAFAVPILSRGRLPISRRQLVLTGVAILLLIFASLIIWRPLISRVQSNIAAVRQSKSELSHYQWPDYPIQDQVRREIDLGKVILGYEQALELDPDNASANRRLGQIYLSQGYYERALPYLLAAYQSMPWDNATRQLVGEALIVTGRVEEGAKLWSTVDNELDQLNLRLYWYQFLGDDERQKSIQRAISMRQNQGNRE